jgi:transcription initiation factor IIF auxiliary subunit
MSLKLKNDWKYKGDDRWNWEIYLTSEKQSELDGVNSVKYILHSTFKDPVREIKDSAGGFRLKSNAWGSFEVKAFVYFKNGKKIKLKHDLELYYDPEQGSSN